jgi:outer membrane lipoprotein-sorting protein
MRAILLSAALAAICLPVWAADAKADNVNPEDVIKKFAAREAEFREARNNYTYTQTVKLEVLDSGGNSTGELWTERDDIIFSPEGKRGEKVMWAPVSTLHQIILTPEDQDDLRNVQPFVLTTSDIPDYQVDYLGREKVDEIGCYTFSVKPRKLTLGKRYFEGEIWVDDRDLQIVKTYGKGVGTIKKSSDNQFPKFETYREQIDGKYWFPTYTHADDTLHFKDGENVHIRMTVKYQDYKKFVGRSTIKYGDVVDEKGQPQTPPPAKKK